MQCFARLSTIVLFSAWIVKLFPEIDWISGNMRGYAVYRRKRLAFRDILRALVDEVDVSGQSGLSGRDRVADVSLDRGTASSHSTASTPSS